MATVWATKNSHERQSMASEWTVIKKAESEKAERSGNLIARKVDSKEGRGQIRGMHSGVAEKYIILLDRNLSLSCLIRPPVRRHVTPTREGGKEGEGHEAESHVE